jgi:FtsH-binding integral membrane protein
MLRNEDAQFVEYWQKNRLNKKKVWRQLSLGLPLASFLVIAIFLNFLSGWDKRAEMKFNSSSSSLILVLLIACILIVVFIVIFSVRHQWDLNEQRFNELLNQSQKNE